MRIAHVIEWLTTLGGGPPSVLGSLARIQAAAGYEVTVVAAMKSPPPHVLAPGENELIAVRPGVARHHVRWYSRAVAHEIREQIRGNDIVHIHATWRYHFWAAASAAKSYGIPYVISPHGNLDHFSLTRRKYVKWPYFMLFDRRMMNHAAAIHCCSRMEMRDICQLPIVSRKFVIPNPVEDELFQQPPDDDALQRQLPQLRQDQKVISFLGRFNTIKRLDVLVAAFQKVANQHPQWVLVLAGPHEDSALVNRLAHDVQSAGLGHRVFMPGMIHGQAKAALLRRSEIYVQASIHENFCVSVAEAMRFGVPCIVSQEVALADEVASAGAGLVCRGTAPEFAASLDQLMSDAALRSQCGQCGLQVAEQFRPQEVVRRLTAEYEKCLLKTNGTG
jgi:glycosyltransferase involved in cell wall biosynthesis